MEYRSGPIADTGFAKVVATPSGLRCRASWFDGLTMRRLEGRCGLATLPPPSHSASP